jgi:hypothetical protein
MRRRLSLAVLLGMLAAFPASPVSAQSGVHLDPNSPAGKEYAVPIDKARREALGAPSPSTGRAKADPTPADGSQQLFGAGIKPAPRGSGGSTSGGRTRKPGDPPAAVVSPAAAAGADDGSPTLVTGGIALAALLAAGALGLLLRRGLR